MCCYIGILALRTSGASDSQPDSGVMACYGCNAQPCLELPPLEQLVRSCVASRVVQLHLPKELYILYITL